MTKREKVFYAIAIPLFIAIGLWGFFILPNDDPAPEPSPSDTVAAPTTTEDSPTPSETTPTSTGTETPTPTFTPTERFTPTELPTGEDFQQILQTIFDTRREAFVRRDIRILGQIYTNQCECFAQDREAIEKLISDGLVTEGAEVEVFDIEVTQRADTDAVILTHMIRFSPSTRIDEVTGESVREFEAQELLLQTALLRGFGVSDDGQWIVTAARPFARDEE